MSTPSIVTILAFKDLSGRQTIIVLDTDSADEALPTPKEVIQACKKLYGEGEPSLYSRRTNDIPKEILDAIQAQRNLEERRLE